MVSAEAFICTALRGEDLRWPYGPTPNAEWLRAIAYHGVGALLCHIVKESAQWHTWPKPFRHALVREARQQAALDLVRSQELARVLAALASQGVQPLLMKGVPLAHTHYPKPWLRRCCDVDLLINKGDLRPVAGALGQLRYERANSTSGELVSFQTSFWRRVDRVPIVLDVHWRLSNRQRFAQALSHAELMHAARPVEALGPRALALAPVHALLLACMHRTSHLAGGDGDRLIWLYDVHLLASRLARGELERFAELAVDKRVHDCCLAALRESERCFGSRVPADVTTCLSRDTAVPLRGFRGGLSAELIDNLHALPDWRSRIQLVREIVLPPASYMLRKYSVSNLAWLPLLYLLRAVQGVRKRLRGVRQPPAGAGRGAHVTTSEIQQ